MLYDKISEKNELILLGHLCSIKIPSNKLQDFFNYLYENNVKCTFSCTKIRENFFISLYLPTKAISQKTYDILLNWDP